MDIEYKVVPEEAAGSIKASDVESSQGMQMKMPPTVPAGMEGIWKNPSS